MQDAMTVLAVGATGKFARLVIPELLKRNVTVRALVRDETRGEAARRLGVSQIAIGDLRDGDSLKTAVAGVDGVFHIGPAFAPDEADLGARLVEVADRAGVAKFVFSSVIQPTNTRLANHASKIPVENALYSSRLQYTVLHPANFMQNIEMAWPSISRDHSFAEPFPTAAQIARVDYRDVAEVAAMALVEERLAFASLELCAGMYTRDDIVTALSHEMGHPILAREPGFAEWASMVPLPYEDDQIVLLSKVFDHYATHGQGGNSLSLTAALGREPRSLETYIRDLVRSRTVEA